MHDAGPFGSWVDATVCVQGLTRGTGSRTTSTTEILPRTSTATPPVCCHYIEFHTFQAAQSAVHWLQMRAWPAKVAFISFELRSLG